MMDIINNDSSNILEVKFTGTFTQTELDHLKPVLEKHIAESSQPRLLLIMEEFAGWDKASTLWNDMKLDAKHIGEIDRVALAGDKNWEKWMTKLSAPLLPNEVKFFTHAEIPRARKWLQ